MTDMMDCKIADIICFHCYVKKTAENAHFGALQNFFCFVFVKSKLLCTKSATTEVFPIDNDSIN